MKEYNGDFHLFKEILRLAQLSWCTLCCNLLIRTTNLSLYEASRPKLSSFQKVIIYCIHTQRLKSLICSSIVVKKWIVGRAWALSSAEERQNCLRPPSISHTQLSQTLILLRPLLSMRFPLTGLTCELEGGSYKIECFHEAFTRPMRSPDTGATGPA